MYARDSFGGPDAFRGWYGHRAKRGDMSPIILRLLLEKPRHGYEIISRLEEKSQGMWRPSAGAVYPNLQMLEEQELIEGKEENGKKVYSLTDKGKEAAEKAEQHFKAHWEGKEDLIRNFKDMKVAISDTMKSLSHIAKQDSPEKTAEAIAILQKALAELKRLDNED